MNINFKRSYFNFSFFNQIRLDKVQSVHGPSGLCLWLLSSLPGLCPGCPWTMSRLSTESMDNVHWVHEQCPLNPWTLSSLACLTGLCPWTHWTLSRLSTKSIVNVHLVHGKNPGSPLSPWTFYRRDRYYTIYEANKKMLIRLRECAGWSAPLLCEYGRNRFSHDMAPMMSELI